MEDIIDTSNIIPKRILDSQEMNIVRLFFHKTFKIYFILSWLFSLPRSLLNAAATATLRSLTKGTAKETFAETLERLAGYYPAALNDNEATTPFIQLACYLASNVARSSEVSQQ